MSEQALYYLQEKKNRTGGDSAEAANDAWL